jgi:hypothetical protein
MCITSRPYLGLVIVLLILSSLTPCHGDDPLPAGLDEAIRNPLIPVIVDVTILKYDKLGCGEIKINTIFNIGPDGEQQNGDGKKIAATVPKIIRGYSIDGKAKIAPLKVVLGGSTGRFILFLDGDLLYSTYNNRFPIRQTKEGKFEVGIGFNGGGAPWKPLWEMLCLLPAYPEEKTAAAFKLALQSFHAKTGRYPSTTEGLLALFRCPTAIKKETWGGPFVSRGAALWADSFFYKLESSTKYSFDSKISIRKGKKVK